MAIQEVKDLEAATKGRFTALALRLDRVEARLGALEKPTRQEPTRQESKPAATGQHMPLPIKDKESA